MHITVVKTNLNLWTISLSEAPI